MPDSTEDRDLVLYRFFDDDDELLYIGKSIQVWSRFAAHKRTSEFYPEAAKVTLERGFASHDDLLYAEKVAIWIEHPRFNEVHKNPPKWETEPINGCFFGTHSHREGTCGCRERERPGFDIVTDFLQGITIGGVSSCGVDLAGVQLEND